MTPQVKPRFPRYAAISVARQLVEILTPVCERIIIAGSLRRGKQWVGDVEILYIGKIITRSKPGDMFAQETVSLAEQAIAEMVASSILTPRVNKIGGTCWGDQNKLAAHNATGIPVDLFQTSQSNWFNYLICRTGSAQHNIQIAARAKDRGWSWNPYGSGFTHLITGKTHHVTSEESLFEFLDIPFLTPQER